MPLYKLEVFIKAILDNDLVIGYILQGDLIWERRVNPVIFWILILHV